MSIGNRNKKTVRKLREKLKRLGISFGQICTDNWEAFISVLEEDNHKIGKNTLLILEKITGI
ncbi:hypothetical protein CAPN008_03950 [Capnocytophaga canis]|uniref:hypothetical protein n=1 Tax=Capnocytophaga canis TaxID=1848903 RepID=UPI001ACFD5B4|nr:hypothetical protein CAPN008_03950 [Capnocytophaga canis]